MFWCSDVTAFHSSKTKQNPHQQDHHRLVLFHRHSRHPQIKTSGSNIIVSWSSFLQLIQTTTPVSSNFLKHHNTFIDASLGPPKTYLQHGLEINLHFRSRAHIPQPSTHHWSSHYHQHPSNGMNGNIGRHTSNSCSISYSTNVLLRAFHDHCHHQQPLMHRTFLLHPKHPLYQNFWGDLGGWKEKV